MTNRNLRVLGTCLLQAMAVAASAATTAELAGVSSGASQAFPVSHATDAGATLQPLLEADWMDRDRLFAAPKNAPPLAVVTTREDAAGGCDGIKKGKWGFHTASNETDPWWQVDLGRVYRLDRVVLFNREDSGTGRVGKIQVLVKDNPKQDDFRKVYQHDGKPFFGVGKKTPLVVTLKGQDVSARFVRLQVPGKCSFALDEVEVYATDNPEKNIALGRPADQKSTGKYSTTKADKGQVATPSPAPLHGGYTLAHTRAMIEQTQRLAERLQPSADNQRLAPLKAELQTLSQRIANLPTNVPEKDRQKVYFAACALKRKIAFCNPLLTSIDRLLFTKRHAAAGVFHMCDQFYGCNARPGGGMFVLENPFADRPKLVDLLGNSVVQKGRLAGQKLSGGSFLSPDLSFDGQSIVFAYTEAKAFAKTQGKEAYLWSPEYSYHLFRCNADGRGLIQLTDGDSDDFDPCFLPNGRIAMISERRGGYLRCGRHCPTYTLFSMAPDGSDIFCLSYHETHEWQPSVDNHGMLVYTRWDYVDRDSDIAHHLWTCFPDGRNPRAFHGNYPEVRENRPWMEMDIRAIPGSQKYVATAAAHHGHSFGSFVLIDLRVPDDNACSQLTRLTPDVPFPESEGGGKGGIANLMIYGTAWPLSEDDYLCAYDSNAKNHGLYWIDRFGNRELIYRDPEIASISPIPLRSRPMPPVLPDRTTQSVAQSHADQSATIAVMNVYDADFAWPAGAKIRALRVMQALPKTTPPPDEPRIGAARQTNARAVLGTVPVEADGSVYFEAPAGKAIYFQAIDEQGLAVQSMRSATYVHPGEQMVCQGCHEPKHQGPRATVAVPLALQRAPSRIQPDIDGSNPFNYVRLVQPVLDRNCVACHQQQKAVDLSGMVEGKFGWTRSYNNLAAKYGFYFTVYNGSIKEPMGGGSRSTAGQFGAQAAKLMKYLGPEHYGVQLSKEDFHRMTLWLDCNSEFYGSYENPAAQARGEIIRPTLE